MHAPLPEPAPAGRSVPERLTLGSLRGAGVQVLARPSRAHLALVADLLWPRAADPAARQEEVLGRLVLLVRDLLVAERVMLLRWDAAHQRYWIEVAESDGRLRDIGLTVDGGSAPLPALTRQRRGLVLDRPSENPALDRHLGSLLGHTSGLLLPIGTPTALVGVLALRLAAPPRVGEAQLAQALAQQAATLMTGSGALPPAPPPRALQVHAPWLPDAVGEVALSPREQAVVRLVAAGLRNKEIAARLGISEKTVKFHLTHVFEKLGAESRVEVVLWLVERDRAARREQVQG
jgi:DNA-binding CsgD family transcriptional regulator